MELRYNAFLKISSLDSRERKDSRIIRGKKESFCKAIPQVPW